MCNKIISRSFLAILALSAMTNNLFSMKKALKSFEKTRKSIAILINKIYKNKELIITQPITNDKKINVYDAKTKKKINHKTILLDDPLNTKDGFEWHILCATIINNEILFISAQKYNRGCSFGDSSRRVYFKVIFANINTGGALTLSSLWHRPYKGDVIARKNNPIILFKHETEEPFKPARFSLVGMNSCQVRHYEVEEAKYDGKVRFYTLKVQFYTPLKTPTGTLPCLQLSNNKIFLLDIHSLYNYSCHCARSLNENLVVKPIQANGKAKNIRLFKNKNQNKNQLILRVTYDNNKIDCFDIETGEKVEPVRKLAKSKHKKPDKQEREDYLKEITCEAEKDDPGVFEIKMPESEPIKTRKILLLK